MPIPAAHLTSAIWCELGLPLKLRLCCAGLGSIMQLFQMPATPKELLIKLKCQGSGASGAGHKPQNLGRN